MKIDKNKIEFILFRFFEKIVHFIGFKRIKFIAKPLAFLFFYLISLRKNVVLKNLQRAFPEKSEKEIKKIAFANYVSAGITFLELLYASKITADELNEIVVIDEATKTKLLDIARGKDGAVFLSGHFGNWEIVALFVGLLVNDVKPLHVIVKNQRNLFITKWLENVRTKFGNNIVVVGKNSRELLKIALNNQIIALLADQRGRKENLRVKFFGIDTPVHTGLAVIALKTKTPIVFFAATRLPDGRYGVTIDEISCEKYSENWNENVKCIMQNYMNKMEKIISKHPEQWFWMHNIWKYSSTAKTQRRKDG